VKFKAGGLEFNATVAEATEWRSPQTGHPLRALTIQFRAQKTAMHEQALDEAQLRQSGGLFSLGEVDQPDLEWRVRESTSSFVGTEPWGINHHVWRIEQVERLACERLIVGSVALEPYEYAEEVGDDGVVRLAARALISEADLETVSRIPADAVEVMRVGISSEPRRMRLSYVWGARSGSLAIALAAEDQREPRVTLHGVGTAGAADPLNDLVAILQSKGVLLDADFEAMRRRGHAARRVSNVDDWPLTE
jgi:hypothetical protein